MKAFSCDRYVVSLPHGHGFPIEKYALLREAVVEAGLIARESLLAPEPATDEQILRVHDADYLEKVKTGRLTTKEVRRMGFPWSPELVMRARCSVGGTIGACRAALRDGVGVNLAGADPYEDDRLGRLALSKAGLADRDREVFELCRDAGIPVATVMAGGYARRVEDTVAIHLETVRLAVESARAWVSGRA